MIPEYRCILEKRTGLIQKTLKWDTHFATAIRKSGLLDPVAHEEIEINSSLESRAYHLARALLDHSDPRGFDTFCRLLLDTGHGHIAETLMADRDQIQWDFQREGFSANSVAYISVMEDQLIRRMDSEQDRHIRDCIWKELCGRVAKLKVSLREEQNHRDKFRRSLLEVCSQAGMDAVPKRKISSSKLLSQDAEIDDEKLVLSKVKATMETLKNELSNFQKAFDAANDPSKSDTADLLNQCSDINSEKSKVEMLSKLIKGQDIKLMWLQEESKLKAEQNFMIKKADVIDMLDFMLSRQEKRTCNVHDDIEDVDIPQTVMGHTAALFNLVDDGEDAVKKLRKRLGQIGDRVVELEMEREVIMKMLSIKPTSKQSLQDATELRLKRYEENERDLEAELESLRQRIGTLAEENRRLAQKQESSADSPTPVGSPAVQAVKSGHSRRSSAPVRHPQRKVSGGRSPGDRPTCGSPTSTPRAGKPRRTSVVTQH